MLDTLHITLIIISIIFFAISAYLYREKYYIEYRFSRYKDNMLEKQSTSYQIPNLAKEEYSIQRVEVETEIPITLNEEKSKEFAKDFVCTSIGMKLFQEGHIRFFISSHNGKQFVKSTFEFAAKK